MFLMNYTRVHEHIILFFILEVYFAQGEHVSSLCSTGSPIEVLQHGDKLISLLCRFFLGHENTMKHLQFTCVFGDSWMEGETLRAQLGDDLLPFNDFFSTQKMVDTVTR